MTYVYAGVQVSIKKQPSTTGNFNIGEVPTKKMCNREDKYIYYKFVFNFLSMLTLYPTLAKIMAQLLPMRPDPTIPIFPLDSMAHS